MKRPKPTTLDANEVHPGLWIGALPAAWDWPGLAKRFDLIAICVPTSVKSPGQPECIITPLLDDRQPIPEAAITTAKKVAKALRQRRRVLVLCVQGRNRSGLVAAMALSYLTKQPGSVCASIVSAGRPYALTNTSFALFLHSFNRATAPSA